MFVDMCHVGDLWHSLQGVEESIVSEKKLFLENTMLLLVYGMAGIWSTWLPCKPINFEVMCILLETVYV